MTSRSKRMRERATMKDNPHWMMMTSKIHKKIKRSSFRVPISNRNS